MVKIQVFGHGMIPGIGTVAPHKEPFEADLKLIKRIIGSGTLQVKIQNPVTKAFIPINIGNVNRLYHTWDNYKVKEVTKTPVLHPSAPQPVAPVVETKVETKIEEPAVEEKKDNQNNYNNQKKNDKNHNNNNSYKPIVNPENK